jgi:transglutaminase-like putative cysteine protease
MNFDVAHTTKYSYSEAVLVSHHVSRLSPRDLGHQECLRHTLDVDPAPAVMRTHVDYFGNVITFFMMEGAHRELTVKASSRVAMRPRRRPPDDLQIPWEAARDYDAMPSGVIEYVFESPSIAMREDIAEYARESFPKGCLFLDAVKDLTRRIHDDFTFDPHATTVATQLGDVIRLRRGVCQDFAQLGIGCLRAVGLPARYVSGYLETLPPEGSPRLTGTDASHAWLSVYCPGIGWIDVDPTNDLLPTDTHITLAWGRDFSDVSPIRGVILGGGDHSLHVSVDVVRLADDHK